MSKQIECPGGIVCCPRSLINGYVGAALGVYTHASGRVERDAVPAQLRAEMDGEGVVGVSAWSVTCKSTDDWV